MQKYATDVCVCCKIFFFFAQIVWKMMSGFCKNNRYTKMLGMHFSMCSFPLKTVDDKGGSAKFKPNKLKR